MSCEGIDLFQIYYKYQDSNDDNVCYKTLEDFTHVDFNHQVHNELDLHELYKDFTDEELEDKIDNLVDFLNLYGDKIKLIFIVENNLTSTVTRINEILSRTTSNLLYVSIFILLNRIPVCNKFKFPLRMKILDIDTWCVYDDIYSKLFIDADVEEYPCLISDRPMSFILPKKYIDYTKITSVITDYFIGQYDMLNLCVNLRNLCIDAENPYCPRSHHYRDQQDCFQSFTVFKKMKCLMIQHTKYCDCDIRQIDHIPYYYFCTDERDYDIKFERNRIIKKNNTIFVPYEIECKLHFDCTQNITTLRQNRFPHVLRLSKVLPKTIFYSVLKLFLQSN